MYQNETDYYSRLYVSSPQDLYIMALEKEKKRKKRRNTHDAILQNGGCTQARTLARQTQCNQNIYEVALLALS